MYKLTCGKCVVCFLFLVMVAFLSCSGFRIDSDRRGAMGGFSDSSVASAAQRAAAAWAVGAAEGRRRTARHRLRHAKHRIDAYARRPTAAAVGAPDDGQMLPPPWVAAPSEPLAGRSQRSPTHHHQQHQQHQHHHPTRPAGGARRARPCQEQDLARKAYAANTVVLAKAESMSMSRVRNYSVSFRILARFKTPADAVVDDNLRLTFLNDTRRMNCESELGGGEARIVKAQIRPAKEYYLFLNSQGNHNYTVVGTPVLNRRKRAEAIERVLRDVTRRHFEPRLKQPELSKPEHLDPGRKVRLTCRVKGYPVPVIEWKKNETVLRSNANIRITYRGRKSTLVIRSTDEKDSGRYTCVAHGVDDHVAEASTELRIANKEKCDNDLFCLNGGTCINVRDLREPYCICSDGYGGKRCDQKLILEHPQPSLTYEDA